MNAQRLVTSVVQTAVVLLVIGCPAVASVPGPFSWEPAPMVTASPRLHAFAVNQGGTLLAIGGSPWANGGDQDGSVHSLAPGAMTWMEEIELSGYGPVIHQGGRVDSLGQIIVFGGVNSLDPEEGVGDPYVYDLIEGPFFDTGPRGPLAPDALFAWCTDDAGRLYSLGGGPGESASAGDPNSSYAERYLATLNQWQPIAPMPMGVADAAASYDGNGHVLVIGGINADGTARRAGVLQYDIATDTWSETAVAPMPEPRSGLRAVLGADGKVYALGGVQGAIGAGMTTNTCWIYTPWSDTWEIGPDFTTPRKWFGAVLGDDDHIYIIGGSNELGGTGTVEKLYTPTCPTFVDEPGTMKHAWSGQTIALHVAVIGGGTIDLQWWRDGAPIIDGPAPGGGTFAGATTETLLIHGVRAADSGVYHAEATNECGVTSTGGIDFIVSDADPLPADWTFTNLHPAGALASSAAAIDGDQQFGSKTVYNAELEINVGHPMAWSGTSASAIDLTPAGSAGGAVTAAAGGVQAGWWWWPYQCYISGQWYTCHTRQAAAWHGTAASHMNLQASGWEYSSASDTDGMHHVGTISTDDAVGNTFSHAVMWNAGTGSRLDLHPTGVPTVAKSAASAIDGDAQYGSITTPNPGATVHAAMWRGTPGSFVDLHPSGASRSWISFARDGMQVGQADLGGTLQSGLWADSALTFVSLTSLSSPLSSVNGCGAGWLHGTALINSAGHAMLWNPGSGEMIDLHAFVPPDFGSSTVYDVRIGPDGIVTAVGSGYNQATARTEAIMWRSTPAPALPGDANGDCTVDITDLNLVLGNFGSAGPSGDVTDNGAVDIADLNMVLGNFGSQCTP